LNIAHTFFMHRSQLYWLSPSIVSGISMLLRESAAVAGAGEQVVEAAGAAGAGGRSRWWKQVDEAGG
jgi:hypothetical protein